MKQCTRCGSSNGSDAEYCNVCGNRLRSAAVWGRVWYVLLGIVTVSLCGLLLGTWLELRNARNSLEARDTLTQKVKQQYDQRLDSMRQELMLLDAQKCSAEHRLTDFQEMVGRSYPLIIDSIIIGNVNRIQQVQSEFGAPIYSDETMYLQPRIYYRGIKRGNIDLYVRWYDADGHMRVGDVSPPGYSQVCETYVYEESNELNLKGWGSESRGNWHRGHYRLEVWYKGVLLGSKEFNVL